VLTVDLFKQFLPVYQLNHLIYGILHVVAEQFVAFDNVRVVDIFDDVKFLTRTIKYAFIIILRDLHSERLPLSLNYTLLFILYRLLYKHLFPPHALVHGGHGALPQVRTFDILLLEGGFLYFVS